MLLAELEEFNIDIATIAVQNQKILLAIRYSSFRDKDSLQPLNAYLIRRLSILRGYIEPARDRGQEPGRLQALAFEDNCAAQLPPYSRDTFNY